MKTKRIAVLTLGLALTAMVIPSALEASRVNARQRRQNARISGGVCSGQLTRREAARLRAREAGLAHDERVMRIDGLSLRERRSLERRQDRLSRGIYRQKHDLQRRTF
jgi:hypothetical protein